MTQAASDQERDLAHYVQNSENFRGLNAQMWQIPIIGMTLTGGLWFGVSNVKDSPFFQIALLLLAGFGNCALILVLFRLRFVMGSYLAWLNSNQPEAKIQSDGDWFFEKSKMVRTVFQVMLGVTALISFGLAGVTASRGLGAKSPAPLSLTDYYAGYATMLSDENEEPDFATAHPRLAASLRPGGRPTVLHIGSGAIRDARHLTATGARVLVASTSPTMAQLSRASLGSAVSVVRTSLPDLANVRGAERFDLILVNGAWAHVPPDQRQRLMDRLVDLLRPAGRLEVGFREGPADPAHSLFATSVTEMRRLAGDSGMELRDVARRADLAGRPKVGWITVLMERRPERN